MAHHACIARLMSTASPLSGKPATDPQSPVPEARWCRRRANVIQAGVTGWLLVAVLVIFVVTIWRKWLHSGRV